ncbi:MAG: aminotransferase [Betaproteobacteria bacterium HGW-Betaproteobacteria-22]|nr:MAG: aminotransferase [Betaproteobacteria bacterium HGW-Betaproteobacteria-22]
MDLLLDVNVAIDVCTKRAGFYEVADYALAKCKQSGGRIWLYTGSVQTLEYVARAEIRQHMNQAGKDLTARQIEKLTRQMLKAFAADKHWMASLAEEGNVFDSEDPEDEQLVAALERFKHGDILLLTRDERLLNLNDSRIISPQAYLDLDIASKSIDFIDLKTQQDAIRPQLEKNIHRVLNHGQYVMGPEVAELETKLADYVGVKHCISASSGTDTLMIAMMALGIGAGDEVITTPFTFIATGEMIALLGAIPVFVDIDPRTYNIDPAKIEAAITPKTKAIMPVSLYGQCADFDAINAIADKHGLPVIEDAAQSFGATYKGKKSCALSTIGSTSFFPSKPLGAYGDGGALFTNDDALAKAMREIRVHGQEKRYYHSRIGMNGRLDTIQAAILLAKLERFDWEVEQRSKLGERYSELINKQSCNNPQLNIVTPYVEPYNTSVYAQYTVLVKNREQVQQKLKEAGIPTAVHYPVPLHLQPAFASLEQGEGCFQISEALSKQVMSLPMGPYLSESDQLKVVEVLI